MLHYPSNELRLIIATVTKSDAVYVVNTGSTFTTLTMPAIPTMLATLTIPVKLSMLATQSKYAAGFFFLFCSQGKTQEQISKVRGNVHQNDNNLLNNGTNISSANQKNSFCAASSLETAAMCTVYIYVLTCTVKQTMFSNLLCSPTCRFTCMQITAQRCHKSRF